MFTIEQRMPATSRFFSYLNGYEYHFDLYRTPSGHCLEERRVETGYGTVADGSTTVRLADTMEGLYETLVDYKEKGFTIKYNTFNPQATSIVFWVEKDEQEIVFDVDNSGNYRMNVPHFVGKGSQYRYKFIANWDTLSPSDYKTLTMLLQVI